MEYLGHIITEEGVTIDPSKIEEMVNRTIPKSIMGLTCYYRRFVQSYVVISKPLTILLKKNSFQWGLEVETAFINLKQAMTTEPVLVLADFTKTFVVETDACSRGMGVVLMQEGRPLVFFSKALAPRYWGLSTYEKEYMAVLTTVDRWRHYLQGGHFIIRTDYHNLKYPLEQNVTTALQQKGLNKLLGLYYKV